MNILNKKEKLLEEKLRKKQDSKKMPDKINQEKSKEWKTMKQN